MPKLIITADIHGNYDAWLTIKALLNKNDSLAVAGDLFDTRYGNFSHPAFDPEAIKKDLNSFSNPFFYVYGNCDVPSFCPGFDKTLEFQSNRKKICMTHGDRHMLCNTDADLIIQGHTHVGTLEKRSNQIWLNPGTIAAPRNGRYTYGAVENNIVFLIDLKTGNELASLHL